MLSKITLLRLHGHLFLSLVLFTVLLFTTEFSYSAIERQVLDRADVFDIDSSHLENGLHVIKKNRFQAKNVVAMLAVDVGFRDVACGKQQAAHVLEHVMFSGTKNLTEKQIEKRVAEKAGGLNGYTYPQTTYFYVDIHSDYLELALDTLHRMMTETEFTEEKVENAIDAVHAELGTSTSTIRSAIRDELPIFDRMVSQLYPGGTMGCDDAMNPTGISLDEVKTLYENYFHASNMTLIIVGDFDSSVADELIENTFALLPKVEPRVKYRMTTELVNDELVEDFQPVFTVQADLGFVVKAVGREHKDAIAIKLISEFLDEELYHLLRTDLGVAYSPIVSYEADAEIGHIIAMTQTTYEWIDQANEAMKSFYERLGQDGLTVEEFKRTQLKRILELESTQFKNLEISKEYVKYRTWITRHGNMRNTLAEYREITHEDLNQAVRQYFSDPPVYGQLRPHTKSSGLLLFLKFALVGMVLAYPIQKLLQWRRSKRG